MIGVTINRANTVTTWGWTIDRDPKWGDGAVHDFKALDLPDTYGVVYGRRPYVKGRTLALSGWLVGVSTQDRENKEAALESATAGRLVRLEIDTGTTWRRVAWGYQTGFNSETVQRSFLSIVTRVTIGFLCPAGAWSDELPIPYGFDATPTPLGVVWAPVAPIWRVMGPATNPVLNVFGVNGRATASSTFSGTWGASDYLEIDSRSGRMEQSLSGTWSDAVAVLLGDSAPILDPRDADPDAGLAHLASVSAGTGLAIYPMRKP